MHLIWWESCQDLPEEGACQGEADGCCFSSDCSMPPCTGLTKGGLHLSQSFFGYVPEHSVTIWNYIRAEADGDLPTVIWVTRFSFLFLAGLVVLQVWRGNGKSRHPPSLFQFSSLHYKQDLDEREGKTQGCLQNSLTYLSKSSSSK